jgi:hypothetical protein
VVNTFPWQPKHALASTIPRPSLGSSPLNIPLNNGGILGRDVFYAIPAEVI